MRVDCQRCGAPSNPNQLHKRIDETGTIKMVCPRCDEQLDSLRGFMDDVMESIAQPKSAAEPFVFEEGENE